MFYPYIEEGGLIWMLPIVFLSYVGVALVMERCTYWALYMYRTRGRDKTLAKIFSQPFELSKAKLHAQHSSDPLIQTIYEFFKSYEDMPLAIAERKANQFAEERMAESRQFIDWLSLLANLSGTLGLAGTVVGISISFKSLALQDAKGISLSLATALYTTVAGIMLFIPSYLCVFACQKAADTLENLLEKYVQKIKDILESQEKSKIIFEANQPIGQPEIAPQMHIVGQKPVARGTAEPNIQAKAIPIANAPEQPAKMEQKATQPATGTDAIVPITQSEHWRLIAPDSSMPTPNPQKINRTPPDSFGL